MKGKAASQLFRGAWFIIILALAFTSCNHTEGTMKVSGSVIDEYTLEAIPFRDFIVDGLQGNDENLVPVETALVSADSNGNFSFTLRKVKNAFTYNFKIVGDSDYAFKANLIPLGYLQKRPGNVTITARKLTPLTFKINRISPNQPEDTLYLSWWSDGVEGKELYATKIENYGRKDMGLNQGEEPDFKWIGGFVNSSVKTRVYSEKQTIVKWTLNRNRQQEEIYDTIVCRRGRANTVYFSY